MVAPMIQAAVARAEELLGYTAAHQPEGTEGIFRGDVENDLGYTHLGSGYFSCVFSHPDHPQLVFKVSTRSNDTAPAYLAWCRANPGPHVPRVHYLARRGDYVVAVLDELSTLHEYEDKDSSSNAREVYTKHVGYSLDYDTDHPACKVANAIRKFFTGVCGFDCHSENVMVDRNGQLILTDPVAHCDSKESRALRTGIERAFKLTDD